MKPDEFHQKYMGWGKDVDGVAGIQCVDLFKEFLRIIGVPNWSAPIGGDGYADNIWYNRSRWAQWLTPVSRGQFQDGDIVLFPHRRRGGTTHPNSHVCFWYSGKEFGTNQSASRKACDKATNWTDALGGLRWKGWGRMELKGGYQEVKISGVTVTAYKSNNHLGLINAGGLKKLDQIDMEGILIYERSGNDLFDAAGTVYGPRICLNGQVDEPEDSKNYLYYAILKDGSLSFGDWDGKYKDPAGYQCMFSPKAIYATGKITKYAPQYGIKALSESVWQAYVAHLADGSFVKGVSKGAINASALWSGLQAYGADSLAIMDGGSGGIGSAQQRYWNGSAAVDAQTSGRAVGDILVFYDPAETEKPADTSESTKDDYQSMYQEKCAELSALQAKYEALQQTNQENLQTANDLKKKYEAAINDALDILKGVTAG